MGDNEIKTRTVYCLTKNFSDENYDSYIGSTSMSLERRLNWHKFSAMQNRCKNSKIYRRMNEVGLENWKVVPLLTLECTRNEILTFERKWLEVLGADLNSYLPIINAEDRKQKRAEYRKKNREKIQQGKAKYRAENREILRKKQVKYFLKNREAIYQKQVKYRENNHEKISQWNAEYREKNKASKRFFCEVCDITCGSAKDLKRHNDTLKHQYAFLNSLD